MEKIPLASIPEKEVEERRDEKTVVFRVLGFQSNSL
jgi:hypothetical protein